MQILLLIFYIACLLLFLEKDFGIKLVLLRNNFSAKISVSSHFNPVQSTGLKYLITPNRDRLLQRHKMNIFFLYAQLLKAFMPP
jgi:hypothetical protein